MSALPDASSVHRILFPDTFEVQGDRVRTRAMLPRPKDHGRLSLIDGAQTTAADAAGRLPSGVAVATVPVAAWTRQQVPVVASPSTRQPDHAHADYDVRPEDTWTSIALAVARQAVVTRRG